MLDSQSLVQHTHVVDGCVLSTLSGFKRKEKQRRAYVVEFADEKQLAEHHHHEEDYFL